MAESTFDVQAVRSQFPALAHDQVYFDNVSNIASMYKGSENVCTELCGCYRQAAVRF
jgi:hypothetical protein